jgi:DNA-3-methyladenine glycosylase
VETEAYLAENDAACHAHRGKTPRNAPMFAAGGVVYVYSIYGVHWCFNVVTETEHRGCAVLIRALEPLEGIEEMARRRGIALPDNLPTSALLNLCNGPGNLAQALGFTAEDNLRSLQSAELCIVHDMTSRTPCLCGVSARVGISKARELPLRFFCEGSPFVSKGKPSA